MANYYQNIHKSIFSKNGDKVKNLVNIEDEINILKIIQHSHSSSKNTKWIKL